MDELALQPGVWRQRKGVRRFYPDSGCRPADPVCGSDPGYYAHVGSGESPCEPCREAHAMVNEIAAARRRKRRPPDEFDPVVVRRVMDGEWRLSTTKAERCEVVRRWRSQGRPLSELGRRTGWKPERYFETPEAISA